MSGLKSASLAGRSPIVNSVAQHVPPKEVPMSSSNVTEASESAGVINIPIKQITPNGFNPNQMTKRQFEECMEEIVHRRYLPHPIIVRPIKEDDQGHTYEIVDGEHRYRVARQLNWTHVPVVVTEVDDFEAMRQCYKRNRHGSDDKVQLGRMWEKMQKAAGLSRRKLAEKIHVPESTIRSADDYRRAADTRAKCVPSTAHQDIAKLNHREVESYLGLPSTLRDKWLEAGADVSLFHCSSQLCGEELASKLHAFGLSPYLDDGYKFRGSVRSMAPLVHWLIDHKEISGVQDYAHVVADLRVPAAVMDALPCRREGDKLTVAITTEAWRIIQTNSASAGEKAAALMNAVEAGVRLALADAGVDVAGVLGPAVAESMRIVSHAPEFIREATHLSLDEQRWLAEVDNDVEHHELVLAAKEATCRESHPVAGRRAKGCSLEQHYTTQLVALLEERQRSPAAAAEAATSEYVDAVAEQLLPQEIVEHEVIGGRSAREVLVEQLAKIPTPAFNLLAAAVLVHMPMAEAAKQWLMSMTSEGATEGNCAR